MGHEGGFYLRSEYYYVHILLAISLNADSSEKRSFFFTPQHRYNPFGCLL